MKTEIETKPTNGAMMMLLFFALFIVGMTSIFMQHQIIGALLLVISFFSFSQDFALLILMNLWYSSYLAITKEPLNKTDSFGPTHL
jgi:hypothetical protein